MPHRFAVGAASAVALLLAMAASGEVIEVQGEPLYTLEYQWLNQVFTPLDTTQSDTVWASRQGDAYIIRIRFYRFALPTRPNDCEAFHMIARAVFLVGEQPTGLDFQVFPQDSGEAETFSFAPYSYWGLWYTNRECPFAEPFEHRVPYSGTEGYNAWLLGHDWPGATDLIIGLRTYQRDSHCVQSLILFWDTPLAVSEPPLLTTFSVSPCYPNPFNGVTGFDLTLPHDSPLSVTVFDVLGRRVAVLSDGEAAAGQQRIC
ncbi:hypothetical protein KKH27_03025 [bacterium]|nr:hypothetical protein [bacterium]MBU1984204.1 hypothetical protein [bacterium]